jgi:hypothetical protein
LLKLKNTSEIPQIQLEGTFISLDGGVSRLIFTWITLSELKDFEAIIYPVFIKEKINSISDGIEHFIYEE